MFIRLVSTQFGLSDEICCNECLFEISAVLPGKKKEAVLNITPDRLLTMHSCLKLRELYLRPEIVNYLSEEIFLASSNLFSRVQFTLGMRCVFC